MTNVAHENIKTEGSTLHKWHSDGGNVKRWYVYRYRTFSKDIKRLSAFSDGEVKVFLPIVGENTASKVQKNKSNRPLLPGLFFVYASRNYLLKSDEFRMYFALKTHGEQPKHIYIREGEMDAFLRIAAVLAENPVLVYAEEFDQHAHNIVAFTDSYHERRFAFLETVQGKRGGFLIVPIHQEEIEKAIYSHEEWDEFLLPHGSLCYKLPASKSKFNIIHIAKNNKYDLDYVNTAHKQAAVALQRFSAGEAIKDSTFRKLKEYVQRYSGAETKSIKFQAKISLMLYKSSIVLKLTEESGRFRREIEETIIPAYKRYVAKVRKDNRPTTQKRFDRFVLAFEKAREIEAASHLT